MPAYSFWKTPFQPSATSLASAAFTDGSTHGEVPSWTSLDSFVSSGLLLLSRPWSCSAAQKIYLLSPC